MSRIGWSLGCAIPCLFFGLIVLTIFGAPVWELRYYVDLNSGRIAEERLFFQKRVAFDEADTDVSTFAEPSGWLSRTPNWVNHGRTSYFSLVVEKSAFYWVRGCLEKASDAWAKGEFTPEAKRESARRFLRSEPWGSYSTEIESLAKSHPKGGRPVELSDLPPLTQP